MLKKHSFSSDHPSTADSARLGTGTDNDPKETCAVDSFYELGSSDKSAKEQHQNEDLNEAFIKHKDAIKKELLKRGLLPSQSDREDTPPIVLLTTDDILIQNPEHHDPDDLKKLEDWKLGKVVLMVSGANSDSVRIKSLGLENENLITVSFQGKLYSNGYYHDLERTIAAYSPIKKLVSANPEQSAKIQFLRTLQEVLIRKGFIKKTPLELELDTKTTIASAIDDEQKTSSSRKDTIVDDKALKKLSQSPKSITADVSSLLSKRQRIKPERKVKNKRDKTTKWY